MILAALPMVVSVITLSITGVVGAGDSAASESPKGKEALKRWLSRPVGPLNILAVKAFEALPTFTESGVDAILIFSCSCWIFSCICMEFDGRAYWSIFNEKVKKLGD